MTFTPLLIAIAGKARCGKDSFASLLTEHLGSLGQPVSHHAFADRLKRELEPIVWAKYGISVWTQDSKEKAIIRDELVTLGRQRREESNGNHWINQIDATVKAGLAAGIHQIVKDNRYANEAAWVHSLGGKVVYLERLLESGTPVNAANLEEAINDPLVRAASDIVVTMPTFGENYLDMMRPFVLNTWSQLNQSTL